MLVTEDLFCIFLDYSTFVQHSSVINTNMIFSEIKKSSFYLPLFTLLPNINIYIYIYMYIFIYIYIYAYMYIYIYIYV